MGAENRKAERKSISLLVKRKSADIQSFVEEFATNISESGMFLRTRKPSPKGTRVKFAVELAGGKRVMRGIATVMWVRGPDSPEGPQGMGLRFLKVDRMTKMLLHRMLTMQRAAAAEELDLTEPEVLPPAPDLEPPRVAADIEVPDETEPVGDARAPAMDVTTEAPTAARVEVGFDDLFGDVDTDAAAEASMETAPQPEEALEELSPQTAPEVELPEIVRERIDADEDEDEDDDDIPMVDPDDFDEVEVPRERKAGECVFLQPPEDLPEEGVIVGIDLGTTNSCVAVLVAGRPVIINSREGYNMTPSVVALTDQGKVLVGHRARGHLLTNPADTVYGAKRLVGRPFDSPVVQRVRNQFRYEIRADAQGRAAVQFGPHVLSLEEVQGLVLRECKEVAEAYLNKPVHRAVITVPAYYSEPQRNAVRAAARFAGLRPERIVNEPTAAALAFGINRELNKRVLVYDLGGGTFDATVLKVEGNVFEVLATGGDTFLGGADFDNVLVDMLVKRFEEQNGIAFEGDRIAVSRIHDAVERAKIALSEAVVQDIHIPFLMLDASGKGYDLECRLTREELEAGALPLVDGTLEVVRDVLIDAQVTPKHIDEVILVGGQSRMPLVRARLEEMLGLKAHAGVHADEAVALGAALLAGSIDKVSDLVLIDVLPMTIGIGMPGGGFKRVLERNTQLPAQKTFVVPTTQDNQESIEMSLFQGESENVSANEYLGTLRIDDLPKASAGRLQMMVTLRLDAECVLHVEARELSTKKLVKAEMGTRYTSEEILQKLGIDQANAEEAIQEQTQHLEARSGKLAGLFGKLFGRK